MGLVVPSSLLGLWASLTLLGLVAASAGYVAGFLVDYLYLSGGRW